MDMFSMLKDLIENGKLLLQVKEILGIIWESLQKYFGGMFKKEEATEN